MPAVPSVTVAPALAELGSFKADEQNVAVFGEHQPAAQKIFDRVGWK